MFRFFPLLQYSPTLFSFGFWPLPRFLTSIFHNVTKVPTSNKFLGAFSFRFRSSVLFFFHFLLVQFCISFSFFCSCGIRWTHEISSAVVHAMSRVRNTQSRAQDALTHQQRNGKQTPDVSGNSRTVHAVLSNNNRTVHTELTDVDSAGKNRDTLKRSLKHHGLPPE